ncbi:hypothetical protein Pmani_023126 [Petrolisthes manimaculis]|uniref:Uncharacterized protein n=1 Tax=Petrolisthes manimaculis TaxID=1843537 RepID=A0AAE1PD25_9EUCA|nr:hypothetical protein Pmani_023126 [Petrolisthes manimaculis]
MSWKTRDGTTPADCNVCGRQTQSMKLMRNAVCGGDSGDGGGGGGSSGDGGGGGSSGGCDGGGCVGEEASSTFPLYISTLPYLSTTSLPPPPPPHPAPPSLSIYPPSLTCPPLHFHLHHPTQFHLPVLVHHFTSTSSTPANSTLPYLSTTSLPPPPPQASSTFPYLSTTSLPPPPPQASSTFPYLSTTSLPPPPPQPAPPSRTYPPPLHFHHLLHPTQLHLPSVYLASRRNTQMRSQA